MINKFTRVIIFSSVVVSATVLPPRSVSSLSSREASAASQLLQVAPTSNSCSGALVPSQCETADQAAPYLIDAFSKYGVTSTPEIAALLSLIAYETDDFKYSTNQSPGRPGQGTRNMQMANYNLLYAQSIPALSGSLAAITTATSTAGLSDDELDSIMALVLPDEYSWGSAAWFLTTQCASIRSQLQAGGQAGYEAYLGCVGTTATSDRLAYWTRANAAFGIS